MKEFSSDDITCLENIIEARRDVRGNKFLDKKIDDEILDKLLKAASNAPSVGFSQPWKFVIVKDAKKRDEIYQDFVKENEKAKKIFKDKELYSKLKLEGIKESYLNIAVLYEKSDKKILGQTSQKKMGEYSVVCAIQNFWLMARAHNIGVGWVSILKPKRVKKILNIEKNHKLIAYLTVGYVSEFLDEPELLTLEWEKRKTLQDIKVI
ncbi:5,6-dimethylbenzimidazole synthase [uncultured Arcobacter sp.]|uniref:5,6-dimethylbenzimidazole synthase n=1 Tax=uncultured Arcobacter sp. TaxID=165434 RepID=UPI00262B9CB7|nr:5,6-dimethylbenzimidazole synthase [uncultured Arcobacter sp.]